MIAKFYQVDGETYDDISGERIYDYHRPSYDQPIPAKALSRRHLRAMKDDLTELIEDLIIDGLYHYFGNDMRIEMKEYGYKAVDSDPRLLQDMLDAMGLDIPADEIDPKDVKDIINGVSNYFFKHKDEFVEMVVSDELFIELKEQAFDYFVKNDPYIDFMFYTINRALVYNDVPQEDWADYNALYEHPNSLLKPSEVAKYVAGLKGAVQMDKIAEFEQILTNPYVYQYSNEIDKFAEYYGI